MLSKKSKTSRQKSPSNSQASLIGESASKKRSAKQAGLNEFFTKSALPGKKAKLESKLSNTSGSTFCPTTSVTPSVKPSVPTSTGDKNMKNHLNFAVPLPSREAYEKLFASIADAYLNHTVLAVRQSSSAPTKYFRVAEIEFYLNEYQNHKDTFTHGDPIQKQTAKWYFHKFGSTYKAGTYKGLDVSIGKGEGVAAGGILLRSLMPITLHESAGAEMRFTNGTDKSSFVEGPCNCVNRILDETKPEETKDTWDIKDLVAREDFSLDIFSENSCLRLISSSEDKKIILP